MRSEDEIRSMMKALNKQREELSDDHSMDLTRYRIYERLRVLAWVSGVPYIETLVFTEEQLKIFRYLDAKWILATTLT